MLPKSPKSPRGAEGAKKPAPYRDGKPFAKGRPWGIWKPSELYNGMIAPLIPFAIKGAIWYQGESNAGRAELYKTGFPLMIKNWRDDWKQGDFPFLFVQLAPFMPLQDQPMESQWAELREAQLLTAQKVPHTAMAVITDAGDEYDIHPRAKEPVGARQQLFHGIGALHENHGGADVEQRAREGAGQ